jgi:DNA/RNA-binding domain of Phe-tRNA-synthetase-like protein
MDFIVDQAVFEAFPRIRLVLVVAFGVDNEAERPEVAAGWEREWERVGADVVRYGKPQWHPGVRPWRDRFSALGISVRDFPTSVEALLRRAAKGGEPFRISPLVDFYNTISLRHTVPVGGFDPRYLKGPLELRVSREGDTFRALGSDVSETTPPGEIVYADGSTVLTRQFVWRQSHSGLIRPESRDVILVSEILPETGVRTLGRVAGDLVRGLLSFGIRPRTWLVDEADPRVAW